MLLRRAVPSTVVLAGLVTASFAAPAWADDAYDPAVTSTIVLQTSQWGEGTPITYPTGTPKLTAMVVEIPPGANTGRHRHPVPLIAYVLEGAVTIEGDGHPPFTVQAGQAISEVSTWHRGRNTGTVPVKIFGVFIGDENTPTSIKE